MPESANDLRSHGLGSVIVPAYNEGPNITRLLTTLTGSRRHSNLEVIVVCNGCTDDTYERASAFADRVIVEDLRKASKIAALNRGDELAHTFPRVYLDADILIDLATVEGYLAAFKRSGLPCGGVSIDFDVRSRPYAVRAFYTVWALMPYQSLESRSVGAGFYALSEAGRQRFGRFPDVIADDEFIKGLFRVAERFRPQQFRAVVQAPHDFLSLVRIKSRSYAGVRQLTRMGLYQFPQRLSSRSQLLRLLRNPRTSIATVVYLGVQTAARIHARTFRSTEKGVWLRDESTRVDAGSSVTE